MFNLRSKVQIVDSEGNLKKIIVANGIKRGNLVLVPSGEPLLIQFPAPTFMKLWNMETRAEQILPIEEDMTPCFDIDQDAYEYALGVNNGNL